MSMGNVDPSDLELLTRELLALKENDAVELECYGIANTIIQNTFTEIVDRYYQTKAVPHVMDYLHGQVMAYLDTIFMKRDLGENLRVKGGVIVQEEWQVDEEPPRIPSDDRSRGTVPVRVKTPTLPEEPKEEVPPDTVTKSVEKKKRIAEKKKSEDKGVTKQSVLKKKTAKPKKEIQKEKPNKKDWKQEEEEERKKLEKLKFQLRGKDYTYDNDGEIIIINKVEPNKLPKLNPTVTLESSDKSPSQEPVSTQSSKRKKKKRDLPSDEIYDLNASSPMMGRSQPAKGVTFKEGNKVVRGQPLEIDPEMTMKSRRIRDGVLSGGHLDGILKSPKQYQDSSYKVIAEIGDYEDDGDNGETQITNTPSKLMNNDITEDFNVEPVPPQSPAKLPSRISQKTAIGHSGYLPYRARQRKNATGVPTRERKHLPAPMYPRSVGFGTISTIDELEQSSQISRAISQIHSKVSRGTIQSSLVDKDKES